MRFGLPVLAVLATAGVALANDRIEVYRDARGVLTFSNLGARGEVVARASATQAGVTPTRSLPVIIDVPGVVKRGESLEAVVTIPDSAGMRGRLELRFDAGVLAFRSASDEVDVRGPGELVLYVDPGIGAVYSAVLEFEARGSVNAVANLYAGAGTLENADGETVSLVPPAPIGTQISPDG